MLKSIWTFILKLLGLYKPKVEGDAELIRKIKVIKGKIKEIEEKQGDVKDEDIDSNLDYINSDKLQ